jgi:tRNA A-37 threonylcarbamoyl transferase component Bud32
VQRFDPRPDEPVALGGAGRFRAVAHPAAPAYVHAAEGARAVVYRLHDLDGGGAYALKVLKPRYRERTLVQRCAAVDGLKGIPGMDVCERFCLTAQTAPATLDLHPDLEFAILMPWVEGDTWYDVLRAGPRGPRLRDRAAALRTAGYLAAVLAALEERGVAHCDLSAGNLIVGPGGEVWLVDVEDVFGLGLSRPPAVPAGTPGYQHRASTEGMWTAHADRFAGAVLLCEMLGWPDDAVRAAAAGDSYFAPGELQQPGSARLPLLLAAVRAHRGGDALAALLERAWRSDRLEDCPALGEWKDALAGARAGAVFGGPPLAPAAAWRAQVRWSGGVDSSAAAARRLPESRQNGDPS